MTLRTAAGDEKVYSIKVNGNFNKDSLDQTNRRHNTEFQQRIDRILLKAHAYSLGVTDEILYAAGFPMLPTELVAWPLSDNSIQEDHPFDLSEVKYLPSTIHNPMALFRSEMHLSCHAVMTEIDYKGKDFAVKDRAIKKLG